MRFSSICLILLSLTGLLSCEKVIDSAGPAYTRRPVLTGLLQPDSLISVHLSYSGRFDQDSPYEMITDATVLFYQNAQLMGRAEQVKDGIYQLTIKPISGHVYRVVADVPGYGRLDAEDYLPSLPAVSWTVSEPKPANPNQNPDFTLSWQVDDSTKHYWLSAYVRESRMKLGPGCPPNVNGLLPPGCTFVDVLETRPNYIVSNSLYPDRFDAYYDSFVGGYLYGDLVRFNPDNLLDSGSIEFEFTLANQYPSKNNRKTGEALLYDFMAVGPHYDKFLKTAVQAYQNRVLDAEDVLNNPFAEITPVYSNVQNGLGVFGAMNRKRVRY